LHVAPVSGRVGKWNERTPGAERIEHLGKERKASVLLRRRPQFAAGGGRRRKLSIGCVM
jgi:hypothetical protein